MSPRRNWDSPTPPSASECAPPEPKGGGGGHTHLRESQFRRCLLLCNQLFLLKQTLKGKNVIIIIYRSRNRGKNKSKTSPLAPTDSVEWAALLPKTLWAQIKSECKVCPSMVVVSKASVADPHSFHPDPDPDPAF
jgi:hypothetical protein